MSERSENLPKRGVLVLAGSRWFLVGVRFGVLFWCVRFRSRTTETHRRRVHSISGLKIMKLQSV